MAGLQNGKKNEQSRGVQTYGIEIDGKIVGEISGHPTEVDAETKGASDVRYEPSYAIVAKIDLDVSEALTGLKALTREAREATKALRELEAAQEKARGTGEVTLSDATLLRLRYAIHAKSIPFGGHPNKPLAGKRSPGVDAPEHVKAYGSGDGWSKKDGESGGVWFGKTADKMSPSDLENALTAEVKAVKSITDDITRSYGLGGDGE